MKGMGILASSAEHGVDLFLVHYADSVLLLGLLLLWQGDLLLMHYADSVLLLGLLLLWRSLPLRCLEAPWAAVHSSARNLDSQDAFRRLGDGDMGPLV